MNNPESQYNFSEPYIFIRTDTNQIVHQEDLFSYESGHLIRERLERELGVQITCFSIRPLPDGPLFNNAALREEVRNRVNTALGR